MAPELAVLIGLPGSGKSSFARARLSGHVLVSKDLLRNSRRKEARQTELIAEALAAGRDVVVDNTHPRRGDREGVIAQAREAGARVVGYWFDASVADCLARNARREGRAKVPPVAIFIAAKRFEPPALEEGFDALFRVQLSEQGFVEHALAPVAVAPG